MTVCNGTCANQDGDLPLLEHLQSPPFHDQRHVLMEFYSYKVMGAQFDRQLSSNARCIHKDHSLLVLDNASFQLRQPTGSEDVPTLLLIFNCFFSIFLRRSAVHWVERLCDLGVVFVQIVVGYTDCFGKFLLDKPGVW
jgi:hypothetical protein